MTTAKIIMELADAYAQDCHTEQLQGAKARPEESRAALLAAVERQEPVGTVVDPTYVAMNKQLPYGTKLYAAPTAQPVQVNAMLVEALEEADDYLADCDIPSTRTIRVKIDAALTAAQQAQPKKTLETMAQEAALEQAHPERVPLTQEHLSAIFRNHCRHYTGNYEVSPGDALVITRAIEAAHGIKQGGQHD